MNKIFQVFKNIRELFCKHQFERIYMDEDPKALVYKCKKCGQVVRAEIFGRENINFRG